MAQYFFFPPWYTIPHSSYATQNVHKQTFWQTYIDHVGVKFMRVCIYTFRYVCIEKYRRAN